MEQRQRRVKFSLEVKSGTARFRVGVQAESIKKALSMVGGRYPQGVVRVLFPVEHEGFFASEPSAPARVFGREGIHEVAA